MVNFLIMKDVDVETDEWKGAYDTQVDREFDTTPIQLQPERIG